MILDLGAPMCLDRRPWLEKYLAEFDYKIEDMISSKCYQVFRFREMDKRHISTLLIEFPLLVRSMNGSEYILKAQVYVIDGDVVFFCRKKLESSWAQI